MLLSPEELGGHPGASLQIKDGSVVAPSNRSPSRCTSLHQTRLVMVSCSSRRPLIVKQLRAPRSHKSLLAPQAALLMTPQNYVYTSGSLA